MRLILLLIVLTIIGLLVSKQLSQPTVSTQQYLPQQEITLPVKIPNNLKDIPQFEQDIDNYMEKTKQKRMDQLNNLSY